MNTTVHPTVVVEEHDPKWIKYFELLKTKIWPVVEDYAVGIEHVGSTSVPGLAAKPVIDIDIVVDSMEVLVRIIERLSGIGYEHRGNLGIEGREAFRASDDVIKHNLYVCLSSATAYKNHILLRDRLRKDSAARNRYSKLKKDLATKFPNSIDDYIDGKTAFILEILESEGVEDTELGTIREANRAK